MFHYQPIADARTGAVVGLEALARWQHPERGLLRAADFIELAEAHEPTMWDLTMHGLDRALAEVAGLRQQGNQLPVAVNVSPAILHRDELVDEVSRAMARHSRPAGSLSVEVTEWAHAADAEPVVRTLSRLAELGVPAALDDFGSGYSSLAELGSLPIETLKLDLALFARWTAENSKLAIHGIAEVAHALGLAVVAERVAEAEQWTLVANAGCDLVQGDRISPPLPRDEIVAWLD